MAEVEIKYGGVTKGSMSASGSKTIKTGGKYCEGDITVQYTRPGGGSPVIQSITINQDGTYNAPSGVDGFNPVIVSTGGGGGGDVVVANTTPVGVTGISESSGQSITIPSAGNYDIYLAFAVTASTTSSASATARLVKGTSTQIGSPETSNTATRGNVVSKNVVVSNVSLSANDTVTAKLKGSSSSARITSVSLIAVKR